MLKEIIWIDMIKQIILERNKKYVNEGTMGFDDYTLKKEPMKDFCLRVSNEANNIDGKIINICYPSEDLAIIVYKNKIKE